MAPLSKAKRDAEVARLYTELRRIGKRYERIRQQGADCRAEAEPIILALANYKEQQGDIAEAYRTVRETVRRIEERHGMRRGDLRVPESDEPVKKRGRTSATVRDLAAVRE